MVIAAKNEARHIADCVASVRWAAEVLVEEDGSSDDTVARALGAGAAVVRNPFVTIGAQRNAAIARASHRWVLVLDADEGCTPELAAEIARVLSGEAEAHVLSAWRVPRRNYFLRRLISHGGWERDRPVRLFDRALRYDERPVHEHVETGDAAVATLTAPLEHYTYDSLAQFFAKLESYSRWWAEQHHARGRRTSAHRRGPAPPSASARR